MTERMYESIEPKGMSELREIQCLYNVYGHRSAVSNGLKDQSKIKRKRRKLKAKQHWYCFSIEVLMVKTPVGAIVLCWTLFSF